VDSADQVVFILQLILVLGPLAVYFLGLGLVNSQAHPCLVNARVDFVVLATAFIPIIIGPLVILIEHGHYLLSACVLLLVAGLFWVMLPARNEAWVIYNIDPREFERALERVCRRLGWALGAKGDHILIMPADLIVTKSTLPLLRNVTLRVRAGSEPNPQAVEHLIEGIGRELQRQAMLPSATGASLVVIGAALLGLPMWYLFHHMDAIVDVVKQILFA